VMPRLHTTIELDVLVEYSVEGEDRPARIYGRAEDCHPAEFAEIDLDAVWVSLKLRDGTTRKVNILPVLTPDQEQILIDEAGQRAETDAADRYADAMERKAEAQADDRRFP
jgi:hypothetical protein